MATESRHSVLVIGPTQSGKTTGLAVPAILEWPGPVIATSVKDDLAATTIGWRARQGPCWIFDPTRTTGLGSAAAWTPLGACEGWSAAQRVAAWLVDATPARTGMADAAFWYAAAAKQLAPLLLAARAGGLDMSDVVRWTNTGDFAEPAGLLHLAGETDAGTALAACEARDARIQSSVATTLETVLAPFEDPVVAESTRRSDVDLDALLGRGGTLYLCGPSHEQHRVQGLFAALVSSAVAAAIRRVGETGRPLDPPLLLVLDEVANIAPIRDLDGLASTGAGLGVQLVTVCQDLAQLGARYGPERARTIANNHRAKVLLSGVSDLSTLDLMSGLAGEEAVREETVTHDLRDGRRTRSSAVAFRRLAPTDELRRIPPGAGVLVYGHLPPVRLRLRPWYADRRLRARAGRAPTP
jgi:type IV secretion system protein VirD4